jgi:geranylgeranyl pyrophosphate synthase
MELEKAFSMIAGELELVEAGLQQVVAAAGPQIREIGEYVFQNKGKRIRPAIFLMVARRRERDLTPYINCAVALELVHTASLLHDDVIDQSATRRGKPAVQVCWENRAAILSGDYLLSRSFQMLLPYRSWPLLELLSRVVQEMAEGEMEQAYARPVSGDIEELYFQWIGKKTAAFFAGCCHSGSLLSGAEMEEPQIWARFGYNLGIAFQLIDDLLDYTGENGLTGKPVLGDLHNGVLTLPLIHTLKTSPRKDSLYNTFFGDSTEAERECLARAVLEGDGPAYTIQKALQYAGLAEAALSALPGTDRREENLFKDLIGQVLSRKK